MTSPANPPTDSETSRDQETASTGASTAVDDQAARTAIRKAKGSLARYRVMAITTGVMLLCLCVALILKYVIDVSWGDNIVLVVGFIHGWIYVIYLVTVVDLWSKMRWKYGRLLAQVLAGVIPVTSFVVERHVHRDAEAKLDSLAASYGV